MGAVHLPCLRESLVTSTSGLPSFLLHVFMWTERNGVPPSACPPTTLVCVAHLSQVKKTLHLHAIDLHEELQTPKNEHCVQ